MESKATSYVSFWGRHNSFLLILGLGFGGLAFGQTSIWDMARDQAHRYSGLIRSIAYMSGEEMIIRLRVGGSDRDPDVKTFRLCESVRRTGESPRRVSDRAAALREAFSSQQTVTLSVSGSFDNCIERFEVSNSKLVKAEI